MSSKELITQLYIGYFNRAPDPAGLAFWIDVLDSGALTLEEIAQDFSTQPEALATYDFLDDDTDVDAFIEAIYDNLFDRAPDAAGKAFWADVLQDGFPVGTFILAIIDGASAADAAVLANKTEVACDWAETAGEEDGFVLGPDYITASRDAIDATNDDPATVDAGKDAAALFFQDGPTVALENTLTTLAEDADTATRTKVADITVTDDGIGTNALSLSGADAALFEIDGTELFLKAGTALDFESDAALDVTVEVDDALFGGSPDDTATLGIAVTDVNEAPEVALSNTLASLDETADTSARIKVADIDVSDDALGSNDLSLSGADAALFEIDGTELFLKAGTALDFDSNPSLDVTVEVDDAAVGGAPDDTAALSVAVGDVNEAPSVALENTLTTLSEDTDTATRVKVADIDVTDDIPGSNVLSLSGADAALFEIDGDELFLKAGAVLDFETNATLDVTVEVDDAGVGASPDDTAALSITVTDVNEAPTVALSNTVTALDEDADTATALKVADITVSDDGTGSNTLSLTGADAGLFEILGMELFLKAGSALDFESNPVLDVSVTVDDASVGADPDDAAPLSIAIGDVNEAAMVSLAGAVTVLAETEDTSSRLKVADIVISDDGLGTNALSLSGVDAALFEIDGTELFLKAGTALDFESNPVLDVSVDADDASLGTSPDDSAPLAITVTDSNEPPTVTVINLPTSLPEDTDTAARVKVGDIVITDDLAGVNDLSLSGTDAALFEIDGTELFLKAGAVLDFETNASLDVTVEVDDASIGAGAEDTAAVAIPVTDVNEAPMVALAAPLADIAEDASTASRVKVADIVVSDDAIGTNALSLTGDDAALFEIDGAELFLKAGTVLDFETNPSLDVTVEVDDASIGASPDDSAALAVAVINVNEAPSVSVTAGGNAIFEGTNTTNALTIGTIQVTDDGTGTNSLALTGADAALFEIVGNALRLKAGTVLDAIANPSLDVTVTVDDPTVGGSPDDSDSVSISVAPGVPGLAGDNTEEVRLSGNASSTIRFGQIEVADADPGTPGDQPGFVFNTDPGGTPYAGVASNSLSLIDVTALDGLASFGVIARADSEDFTIDNSGSAGDVEACLGEGNVFGVPTTPSVSATGTWTFDNTGATGSMEIQIKAIDVAPGGTLDFNNVDICITGEVDFTDVVFDVDGTSTIEVKAGASLTLTVEQVDDLEDAGPVVIFGEGTVVVTGESNTADGEVDTTFGAVIQTATMDLSAVTLDAADTTLEIDVAGAMSDDMATPLVDANGDRVPQTVIGSANNDAVTILASAGDIGPGSNQTIDVITRLGADNGDIGVPAETPSTNTPDDLTPEEAGDVISRGSVAVNLQIEVDEGFDQLDSITSNSGGPSGTADIVQVASGAEFYAAGVGAVWEADANSSNDGVAVIEADGSTSTENIDVSLASGSWILIGSEDAGAGGMTTLIGSDQDDTLIDGTADDDNNDMEEDEFTGSGGADTFFFGVERSEVAEAAVTVVAAGADFEEIDVGYTAGGAGETLRFEFDIGAVSPAFVTIIDPASDFTGAGGPANVAAALAAAINARSDASATVSGTVVTARGIDGRQFDLINVREDPSGAANDVTGSFTLDELDDITDYADDPTDPEAGAGDNDDRTEVTLDFTGTVNDDEEYTITIRRSDGSEYEANHTVSGGETLQQVVDALAADLNANSGGDQTAYSVGTGAVPGDTTQSGAAGPDQIVIYDTDQKDGGFEVILTSGGSGVAATSSVIALGSSSKLDGTQTDVNGDAVTGANADVITDFTTGVDKIDFAELGAGTDPGAYAEGAAPVLDTFAAALVDATNEFTTNGTTYYMTSTSGDGGLLFYDVNGNGEADGVVNLQGVDASTFGAGDII